MQHFRFSSRHRRNTWNSYNFEMEKVEKFRIAHISIVSWKEDAYAPSDETLLRVNKTGADQ